MIKKLSLITLISIAPALMVQNINAEDITNGIVKWSKEKEESVREDIYANGKNKGKSLHGDVKKAAALLNTLDQYGGAFLSGPTGKKVSFMTNSINLLLNDDLEGLVAQEVIHMAFLPFPKGKKLFNLCYTKKPLDFSGTAIDLCALIPDDPKFNVCDNSMLPEIPGYKKLDSLEMRIQDMATFYTNDPSYVIEPSPFERLRQRCESLRKAKPAPKDKTSTLDKITNANPSNSSKFKGEMADNINVKTALNSGVLSPAFISKIKVNADVLKTIDGKPTKTKELIEPFAGLADQSNPLNQKVYAYLLEIAKAAALEGATPKEIEDLFKTIALNPDKVNTVFENQLEREQALKKMVDNKNSTLNLVPDERRLISEAVTAKKEKQALDEEIINEYLNRYKVLVAKKVNLQTQNYKDKQLITDTIVTKSTVNSYAKNASNPFFTRMALIGEDNQRLENMADEIIKFKVAGESEVNRFERKLRAKILSMKSWEDEMVANQKMLGFKDSEIVTPPQGDTISEKVTSAGVDIATKAAKEQAEQLTKKIALSLGNALDD